jgi:hypothetical protein
MAENRSRLSLKIIFYSCSPKQKVKIKQNKTKKATMHRGPIENTCDRRRKDDPTYRLSTKLNLDYVAYIEVPSH